MKSSLGYGGFEIRRKIGAGSQGNVFEAACVQDVYGLVPVGTTVALKISSSADMDQERRDRLVRRVGELKSLDHPHVVKYYGCFTAEPGGQVDGEGPVFGIALEFLKGETLKERLARSPVGLDADDALRIARAAAEALEYTTSRGIVHRDIKPANIFLCEDGGVKIIDFGVAAQETGTQTTMAGNFKGTLDYMAPDFADAEFRGDAASDVFSLAAVIHEMLCGSLPYPPLGRDGQHVVFEFLSRWRDALDGKASPVAVSNRVRRILVGADELLEKALAVRRADRFPGFGELVSALDRIGRVEVRHGRRAYVYQQFIGRGGFGEVFKAKDARTGEAYAVKRLLNADYAERFRLEAETMKRLEDPCFVRFVDFFERDAASGGDAFLVMRFLEGMPGRSLRDAINRSNGQGLPKLAVLLVFERYARGLAKMHSEGVIHRDIKPSNLYYAEGAPEEAAIMDFGIVRDVKAAATIGNVPCTLDYAPPEVVVGESRGEATMDVYALGLCLYEALSGKLAYPKLPSGTAGFMQFFERVRLGIPPPLNDERVKADAALLSLLADMTALDPAKRVQTAEEVARRIRAIVYRADETEWTVEPETDVTRPIDAAAAHALWQSYIDAARPSPPSRSVRWAAALVLGAGLLAAAYFLPPLLRDRGAEPTPVTVVPKVVALPSSPPPETNVPPRVVLARVVAPRNGDGVFCSVNGRPVVDGMELAPGPYECVYSKFGCDDQVHEFEVGAGDEKVELPRPSAWREKPVVVSVPALDAGVVCKIAGENVTTNVSLRPGEYACVYARDGYLAQTNWVNVRAGWPLTLPSPDVWRPVFRPEPPAPAPKKIAPVPLVVPKTGGDVFCAVNGRPVKSGDRLMPGSYECVYSRFGCQDQTFPFEIVADSKSHALPAPAAWTELPVPVNVPVLGKGVACSVDGISAVSNVSLRPGPHVYVYTNAGYLAQTNRITVRVGVPFNLPAPDPWTALPVAVSVPALEKGVVCRIDGKEAALGVRLLPGPHVGVYSKSGFFSQTNRITVLAGVPTRLPPPGAWVRLPAVVKPPAPAPKPKPKPTPAPASKLPPPAVLDDALFNYENEEYFEAVRCFCEAVKTGYVLTAEEGRMARRAYEIHKAKLDALIKNINDDIKIRRTPIRPLKEVEDERLTLLRYLRSLGLGAGAASR